MRVKILTTIGAVVDGRMMHFQNGDEADLPDEVAEGLIAAGMAERVAVKIKRKPKGRKAVKVKQPEG